MIVDMITRELIEQYCEPYEYNRGYIQVVQNQLHQSGFRPDYPYIDIQSDVESVSLHWTTYTAKLRVDMKNSRFVHWSCTCGNHKSTSFCQHVAAVAILFKKCQDNGTFDEFIPPEDKTTDYPIQRFLAAAEPSFLPDRSHTIYLEPWAELVQDDDDFNQLQVHFKIGRRGERSYIVRSINDLVAKERSNMNYSPSKKLSFLPCDDSFEAASAPVFQFFKRASNPHNSVAPQRSWYRSSYEYVQMTRDLLLSGMYLDMFMDAASNLPIHLDVSFEIPTLAYRVVDELPKFTGSLKPVQNHGFEFHTVTPYFIKGADYCYFIQPDRKVICRVKNEEAKVLEQFVNATSVSNRDTFFIRQNDLRPFLNSLYPYLSSSEQFDLLVPDIERYMPVTPVFSFYLDLPQDNLITCELYATYENRRYNVFEGMEEDRNQRMVTMEQSILNKVNNWFNTFDPTNHRMAIIDDDERAVSFLTDGIPALQGYGMVYISDALKRLQVHSSGRFAVGVSLKADLLQLHLTSDQRTLDDLSEILSRYTPKKKYYRLKNGNYFKVEDEEELEALASLTRDLQLSPKEIRSGEARIPSYRAMYLDRTASSSALEINRDAQFNQLIHAFSEDEPDTDVPAGLNGTLRPYQKEGYLWLRKLRRNHFAALLADEMGLGKTIQVITLLLSIQDRHQCIIVCPASLVYNWKNEFSRFAPEIPVTAVSGSQTLRKHLIDSVSEQGVIITSYDSLKRDIELYEEKTFDVEVIDEAQFIKNAATQASESVKMLKASFRIALTGTPIENRLSELWSIFDYLLPGFLYPYAYFRKTIESPIVKERDGFAQERLRQMISPFILRRRKADVLSDLPEKLEEIYYAPLEGEQQDLYEARKQRLKLMLEQESDDEFRKNRIAVLAELTRLRQTCCDPGLIYDNYQGNSAKQDLCIELIQTAVESGHKVLLFSQFKTMLEKLNQKLDDVGISHYSIFGETPQKKRIELVDAFQSDDTSVFTISLKAGGTGLNLTAADIVIHYDPWWNTAVENQASDRAHRIGQTNIVTVYRLIVKDTLEERIIDLQESKKDLADEILGNEEMSSSALTREQLLDIL